MSSPSASRTYDGQSSLPRLPIPTLEETLERFPAVVSALFASSQDPTKEMEICLGEIQHFLKTDGPVLQELLVEYDRRGREDGKIGSFVEEFWSDAYLAPDSSVVMNLNPFFVLEDGPDTKKANCQSRRAASLCFSAIKFASSLKHERIVPDSFRGKPLCMDQFKALFGACRVPELSNKDTVAVHPESSHVVVLENNQLYFFQALWPDGTVSVNEEDIFEILIAVKADASKLAPETSSRNALGVLTTLPRREWAVARDAIISRSNDNATALEIVDSALFVLVIDDIVPQDIHEAASNMLHGTYNLKSKDNLIDYQAGSCCNRWYDKLQIIVCEDGRAGINFEHSAIDGHTALRFVSDVFADNVVSFAQSITKTIYSDCNFFPPLIESQVRLASSDSTTSITPKKLIFDLPQNVLDKIYHAETTLSDEIYASDTYVLEFTGYGKTFIVRNKISPDSFVQLSMQLAYYSLYGKVVSQYEPVLTKGFYHGRTEAVRLATDKALKFCKLWSNPDVSNDEKLHALREATECHSEGIKLAASGRGIERHLFALLKIAEKNGIPTPAFFSSAAYKKLNHTVLSTSNCGNPSLRLFGFGPVVLDGFGIGYIIRDHGLQYSISSKHRQTKRFAHTLNQTLIDMGKVLQPLSSVSVAFESVATTLPAPPSAAERTSVLEDTCRETKRVEGGTRCSIPESMGFAGVLRRQSSITPRHLQEFGQLLISTDSSILEENDSKD